MPIFNKDTGLSRAAFRPAGTAVPVGRKPALMEGIILAYRNQLSAYRETRVKTASQGQLVIMLYDEAVKQLDRGLELLVLNTMEKKDPGRIEKIGKAVLKAQEIITELMASLDFERGGEIAKNLFSLYTWFNQELLEANMKQDLQRITIVRNMVNELRGAWAQIAAKNPVETANRPSAGINIAG
jgi:flagellar protein FliS